MTASLTTAGAAKLCMALVAVPSPTVSPIQALLEQQANPAPAIVTSSQSSLIVTDYKSVTIAQIKSNYWDSARPTTSRERVIGDIRQWNLLSANWDGEGAASPSAASIKEAVSFVRLLGDDSSFPEPMLLASGHAALYWNDGDLYADIEFLANGRIAYFIKKNGDKHKGVLTFEPQKMPAVFSALLTV